MRRKSRAEPQNPADPASMGRIKQLRMVAGIVHKRDPKSLPLLGLAALGVAGVIILVGFFLGLIYEFIPLGILGGLLEIGRAHV